jgi:hydroxyacylglutathione hydrolase
MLKLQRFVFNSFYENTYLVWDEESKEASIIDPGCSNLQEQAVLDNFIKTNMLKIKYLLNTHCHIDHVLGNAFLKEKYNPLFLASEKDLLLLESLVEQAKMFGFTSTKSPIPDQYLSESFSVELKNVKGKVIETPGHTHGGVCIYFEEEKICFTGDTLFSRGIGRTDLPGGNYEMIMKSIQEKLFALPDNITIYPGHESSSTMGEEKKMNPFL